ncbi:hypothetical protein ALDI51_21600 [Alicycliphilus denitrificans]|nr:hypothetical protein ALDI51_21600 [Alicycliphilus denitrificans]
MGVRSEQRGSQASGQSGYPLDMRRTARCDEVKMHAYSPARMMAHTPHPEVLDAQGHSKSILATPEEERGRLALQPAAPG